jgi:predicted nuclease of restriction endonuclease-like (RecB) superfamily
MYMRSFYLLLLKYPTLSDKLKNINVTWSNVCEILNLSNIEEMKYYLNLSNKLCLTKLELRTKIKSKEYERLDSKIKEKLMKQEEVSVKDKIPDPIVLEGLEYKEKLTEKVVQKWIDENPASFCKSLGEGYSYIESQYKIKIGSNYNYIDILLFNYISNSFVVVEIKVTELKKEHIGQIETYMNYVDANFKKEFHNKTTGVLLVRENNKWLIKYINNNDIVVREFITSN